MSEDNLTHVDSQGKVNMVDIGDKNPTRREAVAAGCITMHENTLDKIKSSEIKKGPVLETARLAGIMAAKKTPDLIPLCHNINLSGVEIQFEIIGSNRLRIICSASTRASTGVEMEALQGTAAAALTVYDMCKAVDREMILEDIRLLKKTGGKSGVFERSPAQKIGEIVAVALSKEKGTTKKSVPRVELKPEHGVSGDAHAGDWHRQVSLLAEESIELMEENLDRSDFQPGFGDFAENIATRGIQLHKLNPGDKLHLGRKAVIEVTQIGKECHSGCEIAQKVGRCIMPERGIFARVLQSGVVRPGDNIYLEKGECNEDSDCSHK